MLTAEANGLRIAYLRAGEGPLVVLLHGFPDTADGWLPVMERLASSGYQAVAPNLRGYPPTGTAPDGDYSLVAAARDALGLVEALGHRRAAIVGVDWGALIAQVAANLDPNRVARIAVAAPHLRRLVFGPVALWRARHVLLFQLPGVAERVLSRDDFAYVDTLYRRWSPGWNTEVDTTAEIKAVLRAPGGMAGALGYYRWLRRAYLRAPDRRVFWARTSVPVLAFVGAADHALAPKAFIRNETAFTGSYRFAPLEGVGHFPHREAPELMGDIILDFLDPRQVATEPHRT